MAKKEFDKWFMDTFPEYVSGKIFLEPYYSIAQIAYDKGWGDGAVDALNRLAQGDQK